jgi:hypothetical protein
LHITTSTGCYFVGEGTADRVVDFEGASDGAGGCVWVAEKGGEEICVLRRGLDEGKIVLKLEGHSLRLLGLRQTLEWAVHRAPEANK